jgi:hypothetical protein
VSVRWRIVNIVNAFIIASVLSGLDVVGIEVELQKVLQGLRIAKKPASISDLAGRRGGGGSTYVHTIAEGTEARQIWFATRIGFVHSLHLITVNGHVVESEEMMIRIRPKNEGPMSFQCLDGDARQAHSNGTSLELSARLRTLLG